MSSVATTVFKVTIGLLVNKGRDKAAEKLKDGDVTDQKFRGLIVREIDNIKSKLDGLSRKDLLASISFFEEGIELLYEVFDKTRSKSENSAVTTQAACAEAISLAEGMTNLELTNLNESATRALSNAKERFRKARENATEAFNNEALEISDRILAMQYRVMATILETVDNPADAVAPCRVCIKELNSLPAVQNSFQVQLKKGIQALRALVGKDERKKIISNVCHVNRAIYDVTQTVGKDIWIWLACSAGVLVGFHSRSELAFEVYAAAILNVVWQGGGWGRGQAEILFFPHPLPPPIFFACVPSPQVQYGLVPDSGAHIYSRWRNQRSRRKTISARAENTPALQARIWPAVEIGENKVEPLRDGRVAKVLRKQGMEHCCVPWSFGQEGEKEHKLKNPRGIATNSSGQFIVGDDLPDSNVKVFDSTGTFIKLISLADDNINTKFYVHDVATDMNDNIYVPLLSVDFLY